MLLMVNVIGCGLMARASCGVAVVILLGGCSAQNDVTTDGDGAALQEHSQSQPRGVVTLREGEVREPALPLKTIFRRITIDDSFRRDHPLAQDMTFSVAVGRPFTVLRRRLDGDAIRFRRGPETCGGCTAEATISVIIEKPFPGIYRVSMNGSTSDGRFSIVRERPETDLWLSPQDGELDHSGRVVASVRRDVRDLADEACRGLAGQLCITDRAAEALEWPLEQSKTP